MTPPAKIMTATPRELGYRFPAEWEPQTATWFSWPRPEGISFPDRYHTIPASLALIIHHITQRQTVHINIPNANWQRIVREQLRECSVDPKQIVFHRIPTNECWCRDHGPAFVVQNPEDGRWRKESRSQKTESSSQNSEVRSQNPKSKIQNLPSPIQTPNPKPQTPPLAIVDWAFNAWGGKYPPFDADDAVPTRVAKQLDLPVWQPDVVMEGGAVDFNGQGVVLTTTDCLLNPNRNPALNKQQIEQHLIDYYGQKKVCWLTGGIAGDDTDGHIDDLARFIAPDTIVVGIEEDKADANYKTLRDVRDQLDALRDQNGRKFDIIELPMPPKITYKRQRLPATYMNFLFINQALLVPTYDHPNDTLALKILRKHLPKHEVIGIDCTDLIWGLGAIHCLSQQQPKA